MSPKHLCVYLFSNFYYCCYCYIFIEIVIIHLFQTYIFIYFTSGGNKRKLSIALALIGAPPLILLDEPTAGVDPVSRRKIWKILSLARIHSGASVILTTHRLIKISYNCMNFF